MIHYSRQTKLPVSTKRQRWVDANAGLTNKFDAEKVVKFVVDKDIVSAPITRIDGSTSCVEQVLHRCEGFAEPDFAIPAYGPHGKVLATRLLPTRPTRRVQAAEPWCNTKHPSGKFQDVGTDTTDGVLAWVLLSHGLPPSVAHGRHGVHRILAPCAPKSVHNSFCDTSEPSQNVCPSFLITIPQPKQNEHPDVVGAAVIMDVPGWADWVECVAFTYGVQGVVLCAPFGRDVVDSDGTGGQRRADTREVQVGSQYLQQRFERLRAGTR